MKYHDMFDTSVGFLVQREQIIDLSPSKSTEPSGYIWKRVFLKGRKRKD